MYAEAGEKVRELPFSPGDESYRSRGIVPELEATDMIWKKRGKGRV